MESTPLSKKDDLDMAKAISKNEEGKTLVDQKQIDKVMENTGITQKVKTAVFKNELRGLGLAAAIGAGVGFTIGFATTLAQTGITPDSTKIAFGSGVKSGMESGLISTVGYGIGRTIGQTATSAVIGLLGNLGIEITENVSMVCNMGIVGVITISVFSAYQFAKLKLQGADTREALLQVGKQAACSLSVLTVSIAVQCAVGGTAGIIVSVGIGFLMVSYSVVSTVHQRQFAEELQIYVIEKCKPVFVE